MDDKEKIAKFIAALREEFYKRTEAKTGWGRVELRQEFERAIQEAIIYIL